MGKAVRLLKEYIDSQEIKVNEYLEHLDVWVDSKSKIFKSENYMVEITKTLGAEVKARYIEIDGNNLLSRATVWDSGSLALEVVEYDSGNHVVHTLRDSRDINQLDDNLNWWLSEIATYEYK